MLDLYVVFTASLCSRADSFDNKNLNVCVVHKPTWFGGMCVCVCVFVFACMYKPQTSGKRRIVNMNLSMSSCGRTLALRLDSHRQQSGTARDRTIWILSKNLRHALFQFVSVQFAPQQHKHFELGWYRMDCSGASGVMNERHYEKHHSKHVRGFWHEKKNSRDMSSCLWSQGQNKPTLTAAQRFLHVLIS